MRVLTKNFRSSMKSWETLQREVGDFASRIPREDLISISHSADHSDGVIIVWYWGKAEQCGQCGYELQGIEALRCPECGSNV